MIQSERENGHLKTQVTKKNAHRELLITYISMATPFILYKGTFACEL